MGDTVDHKSEPNCLFCQICRGEKQTVIQYEDENYCVFDDYRPAAKYHYLIVPKTHYKSVPSLKNDEAYIIIDMVEIGKKLLGEAGVDLSTSRMGFHWPPFHSVTHLHLHVIAPESEMGYISRLIFKTNSYWFVSPEVALERLENRKT